MSRQTHEQGRKHRENKELFLRNIRKKDAEEMAEAAITRKMLQQVERAAMQQYAQDLKETGQKGQLPAPSLAAGLRKTAPVKATVHPTSSSSASNQPDESEPVSEGGDEDRPSDEGRVGEWVVVSERIINEDEEEERRKRLLLEEEMKEDKKRELEEEDEADEENLREFKIMEKKIEVDDSFVKTEGSNADMPVFKKRKTDKARNIRKKGL